MTGIESLPWRKPRRSMNNGNCVQVAACPCPAGPRFRKSSRSGGSYSCVEAGNGSGAILVRDTKANGAGPVLAFTAGAWAAFTAALKVER